MDTRFQFVHLEKSDALEEFTQNKLEKIDNKYEGIISAEIHFKQHEVEDPKGFICNISLSMPGPIVFAESNEESFEAAVVETIKDLERQLKRRKEKMKTY